MTQSAWGEQTQYFFELTPDRVLDAVDAMGLYTTGLCVPMGSMENRVYEVELEDAETSKRTRRVIKFYRPGRWSEEQILCEHEFLLDLVAEEIPVVAPLSFPDGSTLKKQPGTELFYALFPKVGGRAPDELSNEQVDRLGRLLARIHNVGIQKDAAPRIKLNPETYGMRNLKALLDEKLIPMEFENSIKTTVEKICEHCTPWFEATSVQRIHGDCHWNNLLWSDAGPFFLDFDDMVIGPPVQDIWLVLPGRDPESLIKRKRLIEAYETMKAFDHKSLRLVEPLRALRFIHFAAWIGKRWDDPAFPKAFPYYGTHRYWLEIDHDLKEQLEIINGLG